VRVKLDENLPRDVAGVLAEFGHDVDTVQEEGLAGRDDVTVLAAASAEVPSRLVLRVAAIALVVTVVTVAVWPRSTSPAAATGVLVGGSTGPCAGQPPGCGSPQGSVAALAAGRWSSFPQGPLSPRDGEVEVWTGSELIIWGGAGGSGEQMLRDGAAYNPATETWRMLPSSPLSRRENAAAVWTGSEMIVVGGDDGAQTLADAATYDPSSNSWSRIASFPLEARTSATAIWTGSQLVVFGGRPSEATTNYSDGAVYDPQDNRWSALPGLPVVTGTIEDAIAAWTGSTLDVWVTWAMTVQQMGNTGTGQALSYAGTAEEESGYSLDAGSTSWRELPPPTLNGPGNDAGGSVDTNGAALAWTGTQVLVVGGEWCPGSCPPPEGAGASYFPSTNAWVGVPAFLVVQGQWPALWTGLAFVDTGSGSTSRARARAQNVLRAYDPVSRIWKTLPQAPSSVLANFKFPSAVWTGRQLLVWGQPAEELTAASS
jgi:hypothetical protein